MSVKMLLRSRSTPLLSSLTGVHLVASSHPSPTARDVERERSSVEPPRHASRLIRSVSFTNAALTSAATSPISQHVRVADDSRSVDGLEWDFSGDIVPWPSFRRAQSEGDLESLARGSSALVAAAESLVTPPSRKGSGEPQNVFDGEKFSTVGRQWSRRMSIRRQSSLSVIPSNSDSSGSESDDIQDAGLLSDDVPELVETGISGTGVSKKGVEIPDFSTANRFQDAGHEAIRGFQCHRHWPNSLNVQDPGRHRADDGAPDGLETEFHLASEATKGHTGKVASASVRERTAYYEASDGQMYTSVSTGANGAVLVCNSRGCKPVEQSDIVGPMFIAGGFGIGGGGGGRNSRVATGGGGGRGDSLGTDAYYKRALEDNPGHPLLLRNYAKFLHEVKRDTAEAESLYERAILANPGDGELLGLYAKLIWDVYEDEERAASYFEQALQASPDNCYVVAAYASFLWTLDGVEGTQENPMDLGHCSALGPGVSRYSSVTAS